MWVWQRPDLHGGEGGNVLYKSGKVSWLNAEILQARVAETTAWLRRATSQRASRPAGEDS